MIPRMHKNKLLLVSGLDDTFFSPNSRRHLVHGAELGNKIIKHITNSPDQYYGYINLALPTAYWKEIQPFTAVKDSRLVHITLNSNSILHISNEIALPTVEGPKLFNGNDLDFILPPKDYEIHIVGVDINGYFKGIIQDLLAKGYKVYLYSNMIKRYTDTEQFLRTIRNRNFEYCSSASALA